MRTELLRAFVTVAEERHFARAADRLHVGQSPLSQQIRRLERELGAPLFQRSTRRVELTPAGAMLLPRVISLLDELDRLVRDGRAMGAGELGRLAIGFTGSATFSTMPELAARLRAELPGLELDLHGELLTPAQVRRLGDGELDIGVLRPPVSEPGIEVEVIAHEPLLAVLPSAHPLTGADAIDLADLAHSPFIAYPSASRSVVHDAVERACRAHGFEPDVRLEVGETATLVALVAAGLGISLVPASVSSLTLPGATYRPLTADGPTIALAVAWRADRHTPVVDRALQVIRRHMGRVVQPATPPARRRSPRPPARAR